MINRFHSFLFILILFCVSCAKPGTGGKTTLVVFLQHHGRTITNKVGYPDTVFVKYGAKELPGTTPDKFDIYFVGEEGEDHVHCKDLKWGKYYLYGTAMDSAGPYRVKGGAAISIKYSERKKSEIDQNLAVTE